jgi:hypothetical protein
VTLIILVLTFGALVAAGVPLLLGLTAVAGTLGLLGPISHVVRLEHKELRDPCRVDVAECRAVRVGRIEIEDDGAVCGH